MCMQAVCDLLQHYISENEIYKFFVLLDVSSSVGLTLMKWVYTDKAEIPHDEGFLIELVKAAKKYRLKELKERYYI